MTNVYHSILPMRGLLWVNGTDGPALLQGLITNDVNRLSDECSIYAALLSPQGKYLHDFFVMNHPDGEGILLDCEAKRLPDLLQRLTKYRLRARVNFEDISNNFIVAALYGERALTRLSLKAQEGFTKSFGTSSGKGLIYVDPRLATMGARAVLPNVSPSKALEAKGFSETSPSTYDGWRLAYGLPDGSRDILIEKSLPLECGFHELHGIDYDKGCYIGQEITARTHYRAKIRKRLVPVVIEGPLPPQGTKILNDSNNSVGLLCSGKESRALALLQVDQLHKNRSHDRLRAGDAQLTVDLPNWLHL